MDEAIDWFWGVLQGDFNEDPSLSQTIVGSIITAIPIIDQLADIRDVVANLYGLSKDSSDKWKWIALAITLIGLIPVLGSLLKGVFKVVVKAIREGGKHLDEAVDTILAIVRGAGKGDPVVFLKNLPMEQYTRSALKSFNEIVDKIVLGIRDVRHSWLAKLAMGDKIRRLELVEKQLEHLKNLGQQKIPEVMRFLKAELDKLLERAKPAKMDGATNTANTLAHSAKPLLRLEYEVVVRRRVGGLVDRMRAAGKSEEEIARAANAERRAIGKEFKDKTDPDLRAVIYKRNEELYGDPLGPTYEDLKRGHKIHPKTGDKIKIGKGNEKTDAQIIESAQKTGGEEFPWDLIMEFYREKKTGDPHKAAELLKRIDAIVNKK
ncbi:hypothetical protein M8A51_13585 [Schlegelella sp. S2-27]|uniref:Pre-toxin TG domain-containing protein n=1 Tax=Caldimonas mangrovi TaxID=2944811 RepID=A0ABT0YPA2_9BURK|nr:hypothetical protein [Caldimonas mangrovi]MCM5680559.1 hypothetical protein [Caldimonas mangrovi]